jgi:hypothetical protein
MPTVSELLKQSGLTDEQIAALDPKMVSSFSGILTSADSERQAAQQAAAKAEAERKAAAEDAAKAEQEHQAAMKAKEEAELADRSWRQFYDESVTPALNTWGTEKANLEAQLAFYRAQNDAARAGGFVPQDAPGYVPQALDPSNASAAQPRDPKGRYVAGAATGTPGSPVFTVDAIEERLGNGISNIGWAMQEYARLNEGKILPDPFDSLAKEATNMRLPFRDYVARKYDFAGKQAEMQQKMQQEHDAQVAASAVKPLQEQLAVKEKEWQEKLSAKDKEWAEKIGSNPDVRIAQPSRFADVARAVKANERPDPLNLNEQQRRLATSQAIRHEIVEQNMEQAAA